MLIQHIMDHGKIVMEYEHRFRHVDIPRKTGRERRERSEKRLFEKPRPILGRNIPRRVQIFVPGSRIARQRIRQRLLQPDELLRFGRAVVLRYAARIKCQQ